MGATWAHIDITDGAFSKTATWHGAIHIKRVLEVHLGYQPRACGGYSQWVLKNCVHESFAGDAILEKFPQSANTVARNLCCPKILIPQ
jgi:hypothetical protein